MRISLGRLRLPALIWVVCAVVYVMTLGPRVFETSPNDHYSHLAESWLHGQLHVLGDQPDGTNDWACFDRETGESCPSGAFGRSRDSYRWYVSFPPLPAAVILPAVAVGGTDIPDRLFWALLAAFAPALLFILLRFLSEAGFTRRSRRDNLLLTALFAFGTVFFFVAVQGTVWFAAHVCAVNLLTLYVFWALDTRRPILAGWMLGLAFLCRPTVALLALFFGFEALRTSRADGEDADGSADDEGVYARSWRWLRAVDWRVAARKIAWFSAPILVCGGVAMWLNHARFESPFEWGHSHLQVVWHARIERWGLFNYHYLPRNLAIFLASLPWLTGATPYVQVSRHGLALWFTTPNLLQVLWPKRIRAVMVGLWVAIIPVMVLNLMYQNSGWVQFGHRFALDYMVLLFVLLAMTGRRFGPGFWALVIFAVAVNTFGAVTFDRAWEFYGGDGTQNIIFQPDR